MSSFKPINPVHMSASDLVWCLAHLQRMIDAVDIPLRQKEAANG